MGGAEHETDGRPGQVRVKLTRRPQPRHRRYALVTKTRLKNLAAPLDTPGAELAEVPVIGPVVLLLVVLIAAVVLGILFGGFLIAFIELIILGGLAVAGSVWAWLRGHPKVAVADVEDQRWIRSDGPSVSVAGDQRAISEGTDPSELGYFRAT